jgi:hypothetical protein
LLYDFENVNFLLQLPLPNLILLNVAFRFSIFEAASFAEEALPAMVPFFKEVVRVGCGPKSYGVNFKV